MLRTGNTCIRARWIYNLCKSIRIYKNQNTGIDPYANQ